MHNGQPGSKLIPYSSAVGPTDRSGLPSSCSSAGPQRKCEAINVLGPFPQSEAGNHYMLTAMDYFTKWPEAYAILSEETAVIVSCLLKGLFSRFGVPEIPAK